MSTNNDINAKINIEASTAKQTTKSLAEGLRALGDAAKDAGTQMSTAQRNAAKVAVDSANKTIEANRKVMASDQKRGDDAVAAIRAVHNAELKATQDRKNSRTTTAANAGLTTARTEAVSTLTPLRAAEVISKTNKTNSATDNSKQLTISRLITEEQRRQVALQDEAARRGVEGARQELATRKQMFREQQALNAAHDRGAAGLSSMRYALYDVSQSFRTAGLLGVAMGVGVVGAAVKWETAFAGIIRTTDESTSAVAFKVEYLRQQFVDLAQTIPISFEELAKIGTLAGQMGIAAPNVASFTKTVAMFSATTDVSTEQAATAFGRLNSLIPDVKNNFVGLADSVLNVGVNSVATETSIIRIATQISSITGAAGMGYQATIGLSGALASIAVPPELSRGVITRTFGTISRAINEGGVDLEKFGLLTGETGKQFAASWGEDSSKQFEKIMAGIRREGGSAEGILRELGITSVRDVPVLLRLANAADTAGKAGGLLAQNNKDAAEGAGETLRQYAIIADTTGAKLKVLFNNVTAMFDEIGRTDLGFLGDQIDSITKAIRQFTDDLDEPARLLDSIELPFSNADILGVVVGLATLAGVVGLIIAGLGQVAAGGIAVAQVFGVMKTAMTAHYTVATVAAGANNVFAVSSAGVTTATTAAAASARGFSSVMKTLGTGVAIAAVALGAVAAVDWATNLGKARSSVDDLNNAFATSKTAGDAFLSIEALDKTSSGFSNAPIFDSLKEFKDALGSVKDDGFFNDAWKNMSLDKNLKTQFTELTAASDMLDDSLTDMVGAGQSQQAIEYFSGLVTQANLSDTAIMSLLKRTDGFKSSMSDILTGLDVEDTDANFIKLARGTLPEYNRAIEQSLAVTEGAADGFEGGGDAIAGFMDVISGKLTGFTDFNTNYQDTLDRVNQREKDSWVKKGGLVEEYVDVATANLGDFLGTMEENLIKQQAFAGNLAKVLLEAGPEVAAAAAELSPALLDQLVNGAPEHMATFKDIVARGGVDAVASMSSSIASLAAPKVQEAFALMGEESSSLWISAILTGQATIDEMLAIFRANEAAKKIGTGLTPPYTGDVASQLAAFRAAESGKAISVPVFYRAYNIPAPALPGAPRVQGNGSMLLRNDPNASAGGAFDKGGYTGVGDMYQAAGYVHKGEFVMTKKATDALGTGFLYDLMHRAGNNGHSSGGSVAGSSNSYVQSFGGSNSRANRASAGQSRIVEFSPYDRALITRLGDTTLALDGVTLAASNTAQSVRSTRKGNS